jgi:hypothetical protein
MAFTEAQLAALARADQRLAQGNYGVAEEDEKNWSEQQRAALARADQALQSHRTPVKAEKEGGSDTLAGIASGVDSFQGTLYGLAGYAGQGLENTIGVGESLRDWGFKNAVRNFDDSAANFKEGVHSWEGATQSPGNFVDATQYWLGYAAPELAAAAVTFGTGAVIEGLARQGVQQLVKSGVRETVKAGTKGGLAATAGMAVGRELGATYTQAGEEALARGESLDDINMARVTGYGAAAGALEFGTDLLSLGLAKVIPTTGLGRTLDNALNSGGRVRQAVTRGTLGAATEGVTEGLQTGLEDMGAGASFEEARFMDPTSVFAGAVGGAGIGTLGGLRRPANSQTRLDSEEAIQRAEAEAQLQAQQAIEAQQEAATRAAAERAIKEQRLSARDTFISESDFVKERNAQRAADVANRDTEIGQAYYEWRLDNDVIENTKKEQQQFLKAYLPANDAEIAKQDYLAALDEHAIYKQVEAQRTPEAAAVIEQQKTELLAELKTAQTAKDAEAVRLVEQKASNILDAAEWRAAKMQADGRIKLAAEKAAEQVTTAGATGAATQQVIKAPTKKQVMLDRAAAELGTDWEASNPGLSQLAAEPKSFYSRGTGKLSRFETALNKAIAEKNGAQAAAQPTQETLAAPTSGLNTSDSVEKATPTSTTPAAPAATTTPTITQDAGATTKVENTAPVATEMDTNAVTYAESKLGPDWRTKHPQLEQLLKGKKYAGFQTNVDKIAADTAKATPAKVDNAAVALFSQPLPDNVKLSPGEQSVFDTLRTAFKENQQDDVIQSDGTLNPQRIADLAGLKSRQAAQTAITRLKSKIAKAYNLDQNQIKQRLAETRIKNVEAFDINKGDSVFDEAELADSGSTSTLASINQGARDGMTAEDAAYLDNMPATPIAKQTTEQLDKARAELDAEIRADRAYPQAASTWENGFESDVENAADRIKFDDLDAGSRFEFLHYYTEYQRGNLPLEELGAYYDSIRASFIEDQNNAKLAAPNEGGQIESGANPQETGRDEGQVREARPDDAQGPSDNTETNPEVLDGQLTTAAAFAERAAKVKVQTKKRKVIDPNKAKTENPRFGVNNNWNQPATREAFEETVNELTGSTSNMRIHVFDTEADAIKAIEAGEVPYADVAELQKVKPYGWVQEDEGGISHAHFILDRLAAGQERAAFMHEVGGHVGIDNILGEEQRTELAGQIADWAERNDGSLESRLANAAMQRMDWANMMGGVSDGVVVSEAIAYFLEEATLEGVTPQSKGPLGDFVRKIYDAFKAALAKLGYTSTGELTAQDIVDMAYGAARLELMELHPDPTTDTAAFTSPSMGVAARNAADQARYGVSRDWVRNNLGATTAKVYDDASFLAKNASASLKFLHQFIREVRDTMPSAKRWYDAMLAAEKTRNDIRRSVEAIAVQARNLKEDRLDAVNDFIGQSTFFQKWGYDPQRQGKTVKVDPVMAAQFNRLDAKEQALVKAVFEHGENMRQRKIAIAKQLGVQGKFFSDAALEGPYAPLKRFGGFAAELKSQALLNAEATLKQTNNAINKQAVEKLKADPANYVISFFDTMGSAQQFVDANKQQFASAEASERAPDLSDDRISNSEVFEKVLGGLKADTRSGIDPAAKKAFADMVMKMYFQSLDESSARLSGARRMNRAGYEKNMIRSFLYHARAEAGLIANMEHGAEINTAFGEAANEARSDRPKLQSVYNMIAKHYKDTLATKETPIQDRIAAMNSVYMLTTSIGYHFTNATQPIAVTIPRLAGDFKNYSGSWSALIRGYKVAIKAATIGKNLETNIDVNKAPPQYRKLLTDLQQRQLLDVGMEEDLSSFDRFNTGYEALNAASDVAGKIVHKLYQVARFVEGYNRISAAIAAFDMAKANPQTVATLKMTPEEYATAVVEDTQGNFSRFDAPLLVKSLPKITTQYRKYQLMMAWAYSNAFNAGFRDKTISPEEKAMGKRTLVYMVGHAGVLAGASGIPLVSTIAPYILAFLGDADEPQDLERWIRDKVEDKKLADVLTRGVPAFFGVDMSTKLSQGKIFDPFPYLDMETGEAGALKLVSQFIGPAGTTGVNFFRAHENFARGDFLKGLEYSVPKGLRSMIESYRLATEGYSVTNGDVIVDPRAFDVGSLMINALGIPALEIQKIKWTRGQQYELEQWFSGESTRIRREYIAAHRERNSARRVELRNEWRELQAAKDRVRPFFGGSRNVLQRQPMTDLLRAPYQQRSRERRERLQYRNVN